MDPEEFARALRAFNRDLFNSNFKVKLGGLVRNIVYNRTKSGFMLSSDSAKPESVRLVRMKPLSESYIMRRRGIVDFVTNDGERVTFKISAPKLGRFGAPARSNLTLTGQMLEALVSTVRGNEIIVDVPATSRTDSGYSNKEIADLVSNDRPFLGISSSELRVVTRFIQRHIDDLAIKYFS